jgi:hypothetical protein
MNKIVLPADNSYRNAFAIVKTLSGTYVCPGWHPVPQGTTREQIEFDMTVTPSKPKVATDAIKTKDIEVEVTSSKGNKTYTVSFKAGRWDCTCPAKSFRHGDCKHIKEQKLKLK